MLALSSTVTTPRDGELVRRLLPQMWGPLRELFKDFPEEAQLQLIGQLKVLGAQLDQALSQHGQGRVE